MKKVFLRNSKNKKIQVNVVRYFQYQHNHYLIYTLNEKDEKDFIKLYVVKVMEELGRPILKYIDNEAEWNQMPNIIKNLLKEIRNNTQITFTDLDIEEINDLKVSKARDFKLLNRLVCILSGDVKESQKVEIITSEIKENKKETSQNNGTYSEQKSESLYDIRPVVDIEIPRDNTMNTENKISIEKDHYTESSPEIEIIEPIEEISSSSDSEELQEQIDYQENNETINEPEVSLDDIHIEELIKEQDAEETETIPEIIMEEEPIQMISAPDFSSLNEEYTNNSIENITLTSRNQMLSLENEHLKKENEKLKNELKELQSKQQKVKDFIQREI